MSNARHEEEAYWNNEHRLACTSSEGDHYEKSVIFPSISLVFIAFKVPIFNQINIQVVDISTTGCIFHEKIDMWSNSSVAILYFSRVHFSCCFDNHQSSGS